MFGTKRPFSHPTLQEGKLCSNCFNSILCVLISIFRNNFPHLLIGFGLGIMCCDYNCRESTPV